MISRVCGPFFPYTFSCCPLYHANSSCRLYRTGGGNIRAIRESESSYLPGMSWNTKVESTLYNFLNVNTCDAWTVEIALNKMLGSVFGSDVVSRCIVMWTKTKHAEWQLRVEFETAQAARLIFDRMTSCARPWKYRRIGHRSEQKMASVPGCCWRRIT